MPVNIRAGKGAKFVENLYYSNILTNLFFQFDQMTDLDPETTAQRIGFIALAVSVSIVAPIAKHQVEKGKYT